MLDQLLIRSNDLQKLVKVVAEANQQYEGVIAAVAYQRDVTGSISAEEAEVLIADAEKIRDESIAAADKTHKDVVDAAQKQASEHIDAVDWETGEVLSKWDQTKNKLAENWAGMTEGWNEFWGGNREGMIKHHEEEKKNVTELTKKRQNKCRNGGKVTKQDVQNNGQK